MVFNFSFTRPGLPVVDRVEYLGALVLRRPVRGRLDVGDDVENLGRGRVDDHFAGIADCHGGP